jgi:glycosyltransferase involved in cell wall biosynthesis
VAAKTTCVGVDATCWANPRGYGRFTRELLPKMAALAPDTRFICFVDQRADEQFDLDLPNVERRVVAMSQSPTVAAAADGNRSPRDMLKLTWAVARERLDVFFSPSVYTYFPLPPRLRAVVTVHDTIAERFPELTLPGWKARTFWRLKVRLALTQARLVLTMSHFAARDIARVLHVDPDRIRVAPGGPAAVYTAPPDAGSRGRALAALGLPDQSRWFVYVGGFNPHKNIDLLVRAHARLSRDVGGDAPHLVLVGPTGTDVFHSDQRRIRQAIEEEGTTGLVHWPGFLPDDELRLVHAGALALVLPSVCEGFGLPAVEAAACGTPVIATTESPLPELLPGGGIFVAPLDTNALVSAMRALVHDEPARLAMGRRAREQALELTWERGARAALGALNEVA